MVLVYPKIYLKREELQRLLEEDWNHEDYIVLERRDRSLRLKGLNSYLRHEQPRHDLSHLLNREQ